jgi:hypothetical protein
MVVTRTSPEGVVPAPARNALARPATLSANRGIGLPGPFLVDLRDARPQTQLERDEFR